MHGTMHCSHVPGAQSMLNVMGDGGPLASREWDEAVASMSICEEATIVFSATARATN